jgi:proline iminopeptidase
MRNFVRISAIASAVLGLALSARAQEGPSRADFECLKLANSSNVVAPGGKSPYLSFHHVWIQDLKYGEFESNGLKLVYELGGNGKEVVFVVPGAGGLPHDHLHPMLSSLGAYVRLVYFDRRADMLSTHSVFETASPVELADDIDALRKHLGLKRVTLLAHSFGGTVALTYALRYPENVKRLVLVGTSAVVESQAEVEKRIAKLLTATEAAVFYSGEGGTGRLSACERTRNRYRAMFPHYFHKVPDSATLDNNVYSIYFDALGRKLVLSRDTTGFDLRQQLSRINVPVLVLAGKYDEVTPVAHAAELAAELPRARLVVLKQSGHFPFMEENYLFTQWVREFVLATGDFGNDWLTAPPVNSATIPLKSQSTR